MRQTIGAWLLLAAMLVGMSGCGGASGASASTAAGASAAPGVSAASEAGDGVTVVNELDGTAYTVTFPEAPSRAVSLSGFTTEMMLALGLEDRMVGTAYQDNEILPAYREAYARIEVLSDRNPSREVLLAAEPDFITGWASAFDESNFPVDFLERNGIRYFVPRSEAAGAGIEAVYEDFRQLGAIFRVEDRAEAVIAGMQAKIGAVEEKVQNLEPVRVFVYDSGEDAPFTAGDALPSDLIRLAGGENIFEGDGENWITVQWETVVERDPEWIVVMQYNVSDDVEGKLELLTTHPALQQVDAIRNGRIMVLGLSDLLAGVRNVTAVETMAAQFHPEAFA